MSSTRVDFTLTAKTTTLVNPYNIIEPMFVVKIWLKRKCQKLVSITGGPQDLPVDECLIAHDSGLFEIPFQVVAQPESCLVYLAHKVSSFNILSASLSNNLASRIASFADNLLRRGCFGFYVLAHVGVVEEIVDEVDINDIMPIFLDGEDDNVAVSSGTACASKIPLEEY